MIRQLNNYEFRKEISINKNEDIYSLNNFNREQSEEEINKLQPKDIEKILEEIEKNTNLEEKIQNYIDLLRESKNIINNSLLNHILKFLVDRHEKKKKIAEDIEGLKKFYSKINSNI